MLKQASNLIQVTISRHMITIQHNQINASVHHMKLWIILDEIK